MDNVVSFRGSADALRLSRRREVVVRLRQLVADTLPRMLQGLFENLDDDLFKSADKAGADIVATGYFDAMRALRLHRGAIERSYLDQLLSRFDGFWDSGPASVPVVAAETDLLDRDSMSLVDEDELEENLAVTGVVSKSENRYHRELFALNLRFGHLGGRGEIGLEQNPVAPQSLVGGFRDAIAVWETQLPIRLLVYKAFERHVMEYVGALYDDLNDVLVEGGVLPRLTQRIRRNPVAPAVSRARAEGKAPGPAPGPRENGGSGTGSRPATGIAIDENSEFARLITGLLALRRDGLGESASPPMRQHLPEIPADELLESLARLQHEGLDAAMSSVHQAADVAPVIREAIAHYVDYGDPDRPSRRVNETQQLILDSMDLLFQFILDDRNIPDPLRVQLGRLQIPFTRVALADPRLLSDRAHPARQFLNTLSSAAIGWTDDGDRSERSLYGRFAAAVDRVVTGYRKDMSIFSRLEQDFGAYLTKERRAAAMAEERASQKQRSQENLRMARFKVAQVLGRWISPGCTLPLPVRNLLVEGWKDVMMLAYLREGEHSDAWRDSVALAERLVWSVSRKASQEERTELLRAIPDLLAKLREGLASISFDQFRSTRMFKELQTCHIASLRGEEIAVPSEPIIVPALSPVEETLLRATTELSGHMEEPVDDEYFAKALSLEVGQWVEWEGENGKLVRGKLSWRSQVTGTFLFVGQRGLVLAEMLLPDVADLFRAGRMEILTDSKKPLFERMVKNMRGELERAKEFAGGEEPLG